MVSGKTHPRFRARPSKKPSRVPHPSVRPGDIADPIQAIQAHADGKASKRKAARPAIFFGTFELFSKGYDFEKGGIAADGNQLKVNNVIFNPDDKVTGGMVPGKNLLKGFNIIIIRQNPGRLSVKFRRLFG